MTLQDIIKKLGKQGGSLEQYRREYVKSVCGMGEWHKHCPKGKVLFLGVDIVSEDARQEECFIVDLEHYRKPHWLIERKHCKPFDKELMLSDRY